MKFYSEFNGLLMNSINLLDENLLLWNQFRKGNADAFGELMRIHYTDLLNYGMRFTKDEELVKDCLQDLFLSLWKNHSNINETSFVKYYLLKSLRRRLNKALAKSKSFLMPGGISFEGLFSNVSSIESKLIAEEDLAALTQKVRKILNNLSRRHQEVIYLRFYLDADIEEIAEIMGVNRQSIYNLLHESLKKFKNLSAKKGLSISAFYALYLLFISLG